MRISYLSASHSARGQHILPRSNADLSAEAVAEKKVLIYIFISLSLTLYGKRIVAPAVVERHFKKPTEEEPYAKKTVGNKGGILTIKGHGVTLNIPAGALAGSQDIKVQVLAEDLPEEFTSKDEVSLCPSVRCIPSGLTFGNPIQITLAHCAELTEELLSGEGELLLYSRQKSQNAAGDQNITRTKLIPPLCEFYDDKIHIYIKQFSDFWIRIKSTFCQGKRVGCLPFVPVTMPRTRKPILRCYVYDMTEGHGERITKEEAFFGFKHPLIPACELFLKPTGKDLHILVRDKKREEFRKSISYGNILHLERNVIYMALDYSEKPENELNVAIDVTQEQVNETDSVNKSSLQFRTILKAAKKIEYDEDEVDGKTKKKKLSEPIDDDVLSMVTNEVMSDDVLESLMQALNIGPVARRRCAEANRAEGKVTTKGTHDMLIHWRAKTKAAEQHSGLKGALTQAKLEDVRTRLFQDKEGDQYRNL